MRHEVKECTFRPAVASASPRREPRVSPRSRMTPDRASALFKRQLSWRQQLDAACEQQRRDKLAAAEQEVRAIRRSASAIPAVRQRSSTPPPKAKGAAMPYTPRARTPRANADPDTIFREFYERNRQWCRARDERIERLQDEEIARQRQPSLRRSRWETPPRVQRSRSASLGPGGNAEGLKASQMADGDARQRPCADRGSSPRKTPLIVRASSSGAPAMQALHVASGQPVRASRTLLGNEAEMDMLGHEHVEVMNHLRALQRCMSSSQSRSSAGWQKVLRVEGARLQGAGAAPLRSVPSNGPLTPVRRRGPSAASGDGWAPRGRTQSPMPQARARCSKTPSPLVRSEDHLAQLQQGAPRPPVITLTVTPGRGVSLERGELPRPPSPVATSEAQSWQRASWSPAQAPVKASPLLCGGTQACG